MRYCAMLVYWERSVTSTTATPLSTHTQTFSAYNLSSDSIPKLSVSVPSNAKVEELRRWPRVDRHDHNRIPSSHSNAAMAPSRTTPITIIPNPSTSPSRKQSSVKSRCDDWGPCAIKLELSFGCLLWQTFRRDQDFWSSFGVGRGPMMLSKSSLQTVFDRRRSLDGS
jgi:hypothetical protein